MEPPLDSMPRRYPTGCQANAGCQSVKDLAETKCQRMSSVLNNKKPEVFGAPLRTVSNLAKTLSLSSSMIEDPRSGADLNISLHVFHNPSPGFLECLSRTGILITAI